MNTPKLQNARGAAGMTLLEVTVAVFVLLALISILFLGARTLKRSEDRAANIVNIRNVQQAVRSHANVRGLAQGDIVAPGEIIGPGKYIRRLTPPNAAISYGYYGAVPPKGSLYLSGNYADDSSGDYAPSPAMIADW